MTNERLAEIRGYAERNGYIGDRKYFVERTEELHNALRELFGAFDGLEQEVNADPVEPSVHTDGGCPDFAAFIGALRGEAKWIANLWRRVDLTGHSRGDADRFEALAEKIETFAKRTGYL